MRQKKLQPNEAKQLLQNYLLIMKDEFDNEGYSETERVFYSVLNLFTVTKKGIYRNDNH